MPPPKIEGMRCCRGRATALRSAVPAPSREALAEGLLTRHRLPDDQRVHLHGALVGEHRLEVVHVPDDRVLEADSVGTQDGSRGAADVDRLADVVELAEADLLRAQGAGVLAAAEVQRQE